MLQQTRVAAVIPYYERFLARFPHAASLASAEERELLALWSGLGYYSRARNLQKAARQIVKDGSFPSTLSGIRALPGVGEYTAAAVGSISFGLPAVVVDGNVLRGLARLTNDSGDIGHGPVRKRLGAEAARLLDSKNAALFNQAFMELGATVCTPRKPRCLICPVAQYCAGRSAGVQNSLPVKARRTEKIEERRELLVVQRNGGILLWQRPPGSPRLAGFWELPERAQIPKAQLMKELGSFSHAIVQHRYSVTVLEARLPEIPQGFSLTKLSQLAGMPLSTIASKALTFVSLRGLKRKPTL